jgi:hypothetical protein
MANAPKALNIRAKTKPAPPDKDPGKTGYQLYNGGGNADLPQTSLQPRTPCNLSKLNNEIPFYNVSRQPDQRRQILP